MAKVRRIALRAHRGQITAGGELFTDHLDRVAQAVGEFGGGWVAQQTAWLHAVPTVGVSPADLARQGMSPKVVQTVRILQFPPHDPGSVVDRLLGLKAAALVRYAVLVDQIRHQGARVGGYEGGARFAEFLGLPWPPPAADEVDDGHWGWSARQSGLRGDVRALPVLLAGYLELRDDRARDCCLTRLRDALSKVVTDPGNAGSPSVVELIDQWWDSAIHWEVYTAVEALAAVGDPANRERLLRLVVDGRRGLVGLAIKGLRGDGDAEEVEVLRSVVSRPGPVGRWERAAAAARLAAIGGPDAEAALRERHFGPVDPPWCFDRDWFRLHGAAAVPWLITCLADTSWNYAASFALGEIRAVEAVGPLCDDAKAAGHPIWQLDALGKIGSIEAVPTLVGLLGHAHQDVRDHALRALNQIGGPAVVDAVIVACDDPHPVVRDRAARVLVRHGDHRAVPQLIRLCDGGHAAAAADALARIGDDRALPTLWHLFTTAQDRATRHAAGRGLARIDGPRRWPHSTDPGFQRAYTWLLGHKPDWGADHILKRAVRAADPIVRVRAAEACARLGGPVNDEHVRALRNDPDPRVRAAAIAGAPGHEVG